MKPKSTTRKLVRIHATDLKPPTRAELARLDALIAQPVDTSDLPDQSQAIRAGKFKRDKPAPRRGGKVA